MSRASHLPSAVVPEIGSPEGVRGSVEALRAAQVPGVTVVADEARTGSALDAAIRRSADDCVLVVLPPARVLPVLPGRYRSALAANDGASVAYGDYEVARADGVSAVQTLLADAHDLSEWTSLGYVRAVRRDAWVAAGGHDGSYAEAGDYDLRLRLGAVGSFARVAEPLYRVAVPLDSFTARALRRYFTTESSAVPGYGYLFHPPALGAEVEDAFLAALRRHGAFLEHDNDPFHCPHVENECAVSVVIPTHDRAALLRRAIESVLGGTFGDFEILVADNGSRDGTLELVEGLRQRDPRVRWVDNRERGTIASALNLAIRAARGKYVSQLDSDDEYLPATLAEQVAALEDNPRWGLAISYYEVVDDAGRVLPEIGIVRHDEYDRNQILRTSGAGAVRTWHRCVLERLGGFDEEAFASYAEDYDLVLRASERYDVGRVPSVLYRVYQHRGNTAARFDAAYRATRKIEARRRALARRRGLNASRRRPSSGGAGPLD